MSLEHLIAICATTIALSSMIVAVWQGILSRRHNKLSVRPYISILWDASPGRDVRIYMKNYGVGPAFIGSVRFKINDTEFCFSKSKEMHRFFECIGIEKTAPHRLQYFDSFSALSPNEETLVLEFQNAGDSHEKRRNIIEKLKGIELFVEYCSTYEESFISKRLLFNKL